MDQAQSELHAVAARLKRQYGDGTWMADARVIPLREEIVGKSRLGLMVLLGGAGFLLLIACANVVNLLLARAIAREREVALRTALGAGRGGCCCRSSWRRACSPRRAQRSASCSRAPA